jgi:hypothetical protein
MNMKMLRENYSKKVISIILAYTTAGVDEKRAQNEAEIVARVEAVPERRQDEHSECFAGGQAIVADTTQPQLSLNVPVVEHGFNTGACLVNKLLNINVYFC